MFNITLRRYHGLDDSSSKVTAFIEYEINDNAQLLFVGDFFLVALIVNLEVC